MYNRGEKKTEPDGRESFMKNDKTHSAINTGDEEERCVLYDRACIHCGECEMCDLDPLKICDNCGKCLEVKDYATIAVDFDLTGKRQE